MKELSKQSASLRHTFDLKLITNFNLVETFLVTRVAKFKGTPFRLFCLNELGVCCYTCVF